MVSPSRARLSPGGPASRWASPGDVWVTFCREVLQMFGSSLPGLGAANPLMAQRYGAVSKSLGAAPKVT
jgi:hypothetical protein